MLTCHLCWRRYISSLASVHLPLTSSTLRRSYSALSTSGASGVPRPSKYPPPPRQYKPREQGQLLDRLALSDPAKLADTVQRRLARGDRNAALDLTRTGSRLMNSVVSWNHVIKHHMDHGEIKYALGSFNEMKKRGIKPDSHTFTLILIGLSNHTHFNQSLFRAIQIYNSLSLPKSPVPPNVFHTNAVLKVCARAGDLDSMWAIMGKLPISGLNAPNTLTYTTLLNGIVHDRLSSDKTNDVEDGRRVWAGVLSRWSKGHIWIDEGLACAMGRVLLRGEREDDWKEVFTLVEQVFGIKSAIPPKKPKLVTKDSIYVEGTNKPLKTHSIEAPDQVAVIENPNPVLSDVENLFTPHAVSYRPKGSSTNPTRPSPGNTTLSLLLTACAKLKSHAAAFEYWTTFTTPPYSVIPDLENYHDLLRILRRFRSGPEALSVVESMRARPTAKTFFIALSSCKRSGRSKSFNSAEKLLSLMTSKHGIPVDVKVWNMFLQCALKSEDPAHIKKALRLIEENFEIESQLVSRQSTPLFLERALELVRAMIGAVDVLLFNEQQLGVRWGHGERLVFDNKRKELQVLLARHGGKAVRRKYNHDAEGNDDDDDV